MKVEEIEHFSEELQNYLDLNFWKNSSKELSVLSGMTKLTEEVGELAEQISLWRARQENRKWEFNLDDLWSEVADVIIAVSMIAKWLDINIAEALDRKMTKIRTKF